MLYHFLMASLTSSFKGQVLLNSDEYTVTANAVTMPDGPALLKQIVSLTYIDTRATASHIRSTLVDMAYQLDTYGSIHTAATSPNSTIGSSYKWKS
ncbi:hypothetical protein ACA910_011913 [Epithemia clementina (nom. ined.)]